MLLCIAQRSQSRINGKTVAQKLMYFCCEMTGTKLGYVSHYYGPYSQTVDNLLSNLSSSNFLLEERLLTIRERMMYRYTLTEDGEAIANRAAHNYPNLHEKISQVVDECKRIADLDPEILSTAAKISYILKREKSSSYRDISRSAKNLGWKLSRNSLRTASKLLEALGLDKKTRSG